MHNLRFLSINTTPPISFPLIIESSVVIRYRRIYVVLNRYCATIVYCYLKSFHLHNFDEMLNFQCISITIYSHEREQQRLRQLLEEALVQDEIIFDDANEEVRKFLTAFLEFHKMQIQLLPIASLLRSLRRLLQRRPINFSKQQYYSLEHILGICSLCSSVQDKPMNEQSIVSLLHVIQVHIWYYIKYT